MITKSFDLQLGEKRDVFYSGQAQYKSENVKIARANSKGVITALGVGETKLHVYYKDILRATYSIKTYPATLTLEKDFIEVGLFQPRQFIKSIITPYNTVTHRPSYIVADPSILTMTNTGCIYPKKTGETIVTIKPDKRYSIQSGTCRVKVVFK